MIAKIRTGEISETDADNLATNFDKAKCATAAAAVRLTVAAHRAAHGPTGTLRPLQTAAHQGGALDLAPKEDIFDVYHLPNDPPDFLRTVVGQLLAKPVDTWTSLDLNTLAPMLSTQIIAAFKANGTYKPGVPLAKITVLNQLAAAAQAATDAQGEIQTPFTGPGAVIGPPADSSGGGGTSVSLDTSGSFSGSGGFHL